MNNELVRKGGDDDSNNPGCKHRFVKSFREDSVFNGTELKKITVRSALINRRQESANEKSLSEDRPSERL
jgi:hypothetical protein